MQLNVFDSIAGLPLHPLIVHLVVVLLPLSALGLLAILIVPAWADRYGWLVLTGLAGGTGTALVARQAGKELADHVGKPETHAGWGGRVAALSVILLVVATVWFFLQRRERAAGNQRGRARLIVGVLAGVFAVGATGATVMAGHSGAKAVWSGTISSAPTGTPAPARPTASTAPSATAPSTSAPAAGYTMEDVAQHADASSCWTVVEGQVYDVTSWVDRHPGGPDRILSLCGKDGSEAFETQHDGQARPEQQLSQFLVGQVE